MIFYFTVYYIISHFVSIGPKEMLHFSSNKFLFSRPGHLMKMQKKVEQLPYGQQTSLAVGLGRVTAWQIRLSGLVRIFHSPQFLMAN